MGSIGKLSPEQRDIADALRIRSRLPTTLEIDRKTHRVVRSYKSLRMNVENAKGQPVPTTAFMDAANAGTSAVLGYSSDRSKMPILTAVVVHNHLAAQPIESGLLGPDNVEWGRISEADGQIEVGKIKSV